VKARYPFFRPLDLLLVALLVTLALAVGLCRSAPDDSEGLLAKVRHPAGTTAFPLSVDTLLTVEGGLGAVTVEVAEGRVRFARSPCPGQQCVDTGWLESRGDLSVCMPSGVLVLVQSGEEAGGIDAVSF
jgi:hypothetical protein